LQDQAAQALRLQRRIQALLNNMGGAMPDTVELVSILEGMAMYEEYFTDEQRRELEQQRTAIGLAGVEDAKETFARLVEEGLGHVSASTPADDPAARDFARRWDRLGSQFHGNDATKSAARKMWQENSRELSAGMPWPSDRLQELVAYLQRVRDAGPGH
jgi:hypothetical protein